MFYQYTIVAKVLQVCEIWFLRGIGLSDLFYNQFERLTRDLSVITLDYRVCYPTMAEEVIAIKDNGNIGKRS